MTENIAPVPMKVLARDMQGDPFLVSIFLSLLLIGADLVAIHVAGLTLRLVFPVLMTSFALLYLQKGEKIRIHSALLLLFGLLALAGAASTLNSLEPVKSVGYTIWVLFDFLAIITLGYNFTRLYPAATSLSVWFLVFRIHVFMVVAEIAWNLITGTSSLSNRPHLWFYEPSYLAIFLVGYFGASLYLLLEVGKPYRFDFFLSLVGLLATTSATGLFGIFFCVVMNFIVARQRMKLLVMSAVIGLSAGGILFLLFGDTVYFQLLIGFLLNGDLTTNLLLDRAGDRWLRVLIGLAAFQNHPWLGVGIGGDSAYMAAQPLPDYAWPYVHPWTSLEGQPFCNIFVEVLGTTGLLGFIPFLGILFYSLASMITLLRQKHPISPAGMAFFMGFFATFLSLQFDGTVLRYYLWVPLGLALGVLSQIEGISYTDFVPPKKAALLSRNFSQRPEGRPA